jgi:hypothetical protein
MKDRTENFVVEALPTDLSSNMNFIAPRYDCDYTAATKKLLQQGDETHGFS